MKACLAACAFLLAAPAVAQELQDWRPVNAETGEIRDEGVLIALAKAYPDSGSIRLRLLQAQLAASNMDGVLFNLEWLNQRGYSFSKGARARLPEVVGEEYAAQVRELLDPVPTAIKNSEVIAVVPASAGLVESVHVIGTQILGVTSITNKSVFMHSLGEGWSEIRIAGANDLSGIVLDGGGVSWAASANIDNSQDGETLFTGLVGFGAEISEPLKIPAPEGVTISDLSIGPDKTVYASDPLKGGIYFKSAGAPTLEVLIEEGTFRSAQGSAVSGDGSKLYVSDYRYGLAVIDLDTREVSRLESDVPVILDGVDGLWRHGNELIAVQNGTSPMRISAFKLSVDGTRITAARVLEQAHPEWTEPLGGSIVGDALIYVGTGHWDRYERGELREGRGAASTQIRRLPLGSNSN